MKTTVLIHERDQHGDNVIAWAFDRTHKGFATTNHAASCYGQPVIIGEDGKLWNYADLQGITYYGEVSASDILAMESLRSLGLEVKRKAEVVYE